MNDKYKKEIAEIMQATAKLTREEYMRNKPEKFKAKEFEKFIDDLDEEDAASNYEMHGKTRTQMFEEALNDLKVLFMNAQISSKEFGDATNLIRAQYDKHLKNKKGKEERKRKGYK